MTRFNNGLNHLKHSDLLVNKSIDTDPIDSRLVRTGKYRDGDENKTTPKANVEDNVLSAIEDLL